MNNTEILSLVIILVLTAGVIFLMYRNDKVAKFRLMIIHEDFKATMKNIDNDIFVSVDNYSLLPSYQRMIFSFKPLKKKYWL